MTAFILWNTNTATIFSYDLKILPECLFIILLNFYYNIYYIIIKSLYKAYNSLCDAIINFLSLKLVKRKENPILMIFNREIILSKPFENS